MWRVLAPNTGSEPTASTSTCTTFS